MPLLAPTSTPARIDVAAKVASGFIYYVSLTGITGTHLSDMEEPRAQVDGDPGAHGRQAPVAVGFGIRTPGAARAVASFADGVVVGSAAVEVVEKAIAAKRIRSPSWPRSSARCATRSTAPRSDLPLPLARCG